MREIYKFICQEILNNLSIETNNFKWVVGMYVQGKKTQLKRSVPMSK